MPVLSLPCPWCLTPYLLLPQLGWNINIGFSWCFWADCTGRKQRNLILAQSAHLASLAKYFENNTSVFSMHLQAEHLTFKVWICRFTTNKQTKTFSAPRRAEIGDTNDCCVGVAESVLRAVQNIYSQPQVSKQICFLKISQSLWTFQVSLSQV